MSQTKYDLNNLQHQEAIVKELLDIKNLWVEHPIPGGSTEDFKSLFKPDNPNARKNLFKVLRTRFNFVREFSELELILIDSRENTEMKKVHDFDDKTFFWEDTSSGARGKMAEILTDLVFKHPANMFLIKKDGIYCVSPKGKKVSSSDENWFPKVRYKRKNRPQYT